MDGSTWDDRSLPASLRALKPRWKALLEDTPMKRRKSESYSAFQQRRQGRGAEWEALRRRASALVDAEVAPERRYQRELAAHRRALSWNRAERSKALLGDQFLLCDGEIPRRPGRRSFKVGQYPLIGVFPGTLSPAARKVLRPILAQFRRSRLRRPRGTPKFLEETSGAELLAADSPLGGSTRRQLLALRRRELRSLDQQRFPLTLQRRLRRRASALGLRAEESPAGVLPGSGERQRLRRKLDTLGNPWEGFDPGLPRYLDEDSLPEALECGEPDDRLPAALVALEQLRRLRPWPRRRRLLRPLRRTPTGATLLRRHYATPGVQAHCSEGTSLWWSGAHLYRASRRLRHRWLPRRRRWVALRPFGRWRREPGRRAGGKLRRPRPRRLRRFRRPGRRLGQLLRLARKVPPFRWQGHRWQNQLQLALQRAHWQEIQQEALLWDSGAVITRRRRSSSGEDSGEDDSGELRRGRGHRWGTGPGAASLLLLELLPRAGDTPGATPWAPPSAALPSAAGFGRLLRERLITLGAFGDGDGGRTQESAPLLQRRLELLALETSDGFPQGGHRTRLRRALERHRSRREALYPVQGHMDVPDLRAFNRLARNYRATLGESSGYGEPVLGAKPEVPAEGSRLERSSWLRSITHSLGALGHRPAALRLQLGAPWAPALGLLFGSRQEERLGLLRRQGSWSQSYHYGWPSYREHWTFFSGEFYYYIYGKSRDITDRRGLRHGQVNLDSFWMAAQGGTVSLLARCNGTGSVRTLLLGRRLASWLPRYCLQMLITPRRNNLFCTIQPLLFGNRPGERIFHLSAGQLCHRKGYLRRSPANRRELYSQAAFRLLRHSKKDRRFRFLVVRIKHYLDVSNRMGNSLALRLQRTTALFQRFVRYQNDLRYPIVNVDMRFARPSYGGKVGLPPRRKKRLRPTKVRSL